MNNTTRVLVRRGLGVLVLAFGWLAQGAGVEEAFRTLRLGEVKPEGWLQAQLERDLVSGYHGHIDKLLQTPKTGEFLLQPEHNDFVTRAKSRDAKLDAQGLVAPPEPHSWWDGEMIGDYHDSLIRAAFLTGEPKAREKAERYVAAMLKAQDEDGYIGIYPKGFRFHFSASDGELWDQRCALLGLLAYYEFTGKAEVLSAVERAVKLTLAQYGPGTNYFENPGQRDSGVAHGLMFEDVLEWLYRLKGDEQYRRAALSLYEDYSASKRVKNQAMQLEKLLNPDTPLGGHGPDIMGFLRIPLLCYYLSGKPEYKQAWENSMTKTRRHLGVGGSPLSGQGEEIKESGQTPDLPYEYCSTFYLLHSLTWAMQKTGEAQYGDMLERSLYNAAQGARFPNGKALTYYSADERVMVRQRPPEGKPNARYLYTAAFYPSCCHNSGARVYPYAISSMWLRSEGKGGEGLVAMLYGPCRVSTTVQGVPVTIVESTGYPFAFEISCAIKTGKAVAFPVRFRVPGWSAEPEVTAAGAQVTRDEKGYVVVTKQWQSGDTVKVKLKPSIRGERAVNGTTALAYGPLIFSLPIPEKAEITQRFPQAEVAGLKDFCGYQYDAADMAAAKRVLTLAGGKAPYGFTVTEDAGANGLYPWERSPVALGGELVNGEGKAEQVKLVPMGCTLLRRTCFLETKSQ